VVTSFYSKEKADLNFYIFSPFSTQDSGFVIAHPALASAIIGPRTMDQFDDLMAGVEVRLDDELLDQIDKIVPPGADIAPLEGAAYVPPAITQIDLRRRPAHERAAA